MSGPIELYVNHSLRERMEWSLSCEQVLGSNGRATLSIQDRDNSFEPEAHWDIKIVIASSGQVVFRGEIINEPEELVLGMDWRIWKLDCADYSGEFPQRLIGAFDGVTWQDVDGLGDYVNIDPNAHSLATDKLTVQALFDSYIRVDGEAIDTSSFVGEYLTSFPTIYWAYSNLQTALEELAAGIAQNLQFWLDPDLAFHWTAIPPWQDLSGGGGTSTFLVDPSSSSSLTAAMFPEAPASAFEAAPVPSGVVGDAPGALHCRDLKYTLDGSAMPEQVYVRGGTGFVYNAPQIDPTGGTVTIDPAGYGSKASEHFQLTFGGSTKVWHILSSGLISGTFDTVGAGGPYDVTFIGVPYNPANGKGGHFWKLLTGPNAGKLVDNDTNYFGYGTITVQKLVPTTTPPSVGIGGSGWAGSAVQDLNKRQAYLDAPISTTQSIRDALGGQALYRGQFPTLRGSFKVTGGVDSDGNDLGPDGWRVGQIVHLFDSRLPSFLNDRDFIVQRVQVQLIAGQDLREYTIDWGDGPVSRYTAQARGSGDDGSFPPPATEFDVLTFDLSPGPNSKQVITGQMVAKDGTPWRIPDKVVKWTLQCYDSFGGIVNEGTIDPEVSATDANGRARTTFTAGPDAGLVYFVFGAIAAI